jgi:hypothetical protein
LTGALGAGTEKGKMELAEKSPEHPGFFILSAGGERAAHPGQIVDEPAGASAAGLEAGDGRERAATAERDQD